MKKLILVSCLVAFSTACTIRKEGGTWVVKKTIIDEVTESVHGVGELASDVKDANEDLSENSNTQPVETKPSAESNIEQ